jgi:hypothetical protein
MVEKTKARDADSNGCRGAHIKKYSADIEGRNDATDGEDTDIERATAPKW